MKVEGTRTSPSVSIENGVVEVKGRSIPEDCHDFFSPIIHEVQDYLKNPPEKTLLRFHLEYINSGSKKYITNIIIQFNEIYLKGKDVKIIWNYDFDDDSIIELGSDLMGMVQIPFSMVEVS
jgi:hypothetical protein